MLLPWPVPPAAAGALGVPRVPARAVAAHDGGEAAGAVPGGRVQRGGGAQSPQVLVRAPQSPGRKGARAPAAPGVRVPCVRDTLRACVCDCSSLLPASSCTHLFCERTDVCVSQRGGWHKCLKTYRMLYIDLSWVM